MNTCSIKGTEYEKEYKSFLSPAATYYVWDKNNEQPLDKVIYNGEVITNPLYTALIADPITGGNRIKALQLIADTFWEDFTDHYTPNEYDSYDLHQVKDFQENKQRQIDERLEELQEIVNLPKGKSIVFPDAIVNGETKEVKFTEEEGQEIYDTFEHLLSIGKSWTSVYMQLAGMRDAILNRVQEGRMFDGDVQKLINLQLIVDNFSKFTDWYTSHDNVVSIEALDDQFGGSEGWATKEKSQLERASKDVVAIVTGLPKYRKSTINDIDPLTEKPYPVGTPIQVKGNLLGLPLGGDMKRNWSVLSEKLSGITNYTDMYNTIKQLTENYPQFNQLLQELPNPSIKGLARDVKSMVVAQSFKSIFSSPEVASYVLDVSIKDGKLIASQQVKGSQNIRNFVLQSDSEYLSTNPRFMVKGESGQLELDLNSLIAAHSQLFADLGKMAAMGIKTYIDPKTPYNYKKRIYDVSKFLEDLGLGNNRAHLLPNNLDETAEFYNNNLSQIVVFYNKIKSVAAVNKYLPANEQVKVTRPLSFLQNVLNEYIDKNTTTKNNIVYTESVNNAISQTIANKDLKYSGKFTKDKENRVRIFLSRKESEIKKFADFYSKFDTENRSRSYLNAEQKTRQLNTPWFYMSQVSTVVNKAKDYNELINTPGFERFDYRINPDILGSVWMSTLFGLPTDRKEIGQDLSRYKKQKDVLGNPITLTPYDFGGLEIKGKNKVGLTTTSLHPDDKVMQDFMSFFTSGELENIRFGDKSSAFGTKNSNPVLSDKIYVPISLEYLLEGAEVPENIPVEKELLNIFEGYLRSEMTRVFNLVSNPDANTESTYYKYGRNLFVLGSILPKEIVDSIKNATTLSEITDAYNNAKAALPSSLNNYFDKSANQLVDQLVQTLTIGTERAVGQKGGLVLAAKRLNDLKFINTQLFKTKSDKNIKITDKNIKYLCQMFIKNGFINNVEFMKFYIGDIANFDKTDKDFREVFKRIPFSSTPGTPLFWDDLLQDFFSKDENQDALSKAYADTPHPFTNKVRTVIYNDVLSFGKSDFEAYKEAYKSGFEAYVDNPKEADAQGVVTLDFYRNYLIGIGRWDWNGQEAAFKDQIRIAELNKLIAENPNNAEKYQEEKNALLVKEGTVPFPPLKLGHYGPVVEDPKVIALHKFSLIPMVPSVIEGKQLEKQMVQMYKNKIDYYTFKSGSKMGKFGKGLDYYKTETVNGEEMSVINDALGDQHVTTIYAHNLREQQYQAPKTKKEVPLATQMMKLVFGDFYENGEISDSFSEETQNKIKNLYNVFKSNVENIVNYEKVKLEKKLGITRANGKIVKVDQLQMARYLAQELDKQNVPENLRKFVQVNDDGTFKYALDSLADRDKLEELILNVVNNKVIAQKVAGESYIQVAGTGFEDMRYAKPTAAQLEEFGRGDLKFYSLNDNGEINPMEVKIGFNPKKHSGLLNLDYYGKRVDTLANLNNILKSNKKADLDWKKKHIDKLTMVGVRIPVQGFQSMEYVQIKEFLPASAGAVMILPAQIVTKSGGDFDIDKLTFFESSYDAQGNMIQSDLSFEEYQAAVANQKELRRNQKKLQFIREELKSEMANNPIYQQRQDLKDKIKDIEAELAEAESAFQELVDNKLLTEEDAEYLKESTKDKTELQRAIADLAKFDSQNNPNALIVLSTLSSELKQTYKSLDSIKNLKKAYTNGLVNTLKEVLSTGELYDSLITPNDNSVLTQDSISQDYNEAATPITSSDVFNPMTSWRIFAENILSKDALGIDAKINTLQKEFQRAGLKYSSAFLNTYFFEANKDADGNISLGGKYDSRGENRISKVLSEFINGHVDIAKEDWIILLGLNQETSPLAHAMILAGTPVKNVIDFLNSAPIKSVLELSNKSEVFKEVSGQSYNKNNSIVNLINDILDKSKDPELAQVRQSIFEILASSKKAETKTKLSILVNVILKNPAFSQYISNFNPKADLSKEDKDKRDLAYLTQFAVVVRQQERIRELTSISDFNTDNYRSSFQTREIAQKRVGLVQDFNESAINFMLNESALAKFNVTDFVQEIMNEAFPLTDSTEVNEAIIGYLDNNGLYKQEDRTRAVKTFKNNILLQHLHMTATKEGESMLDYYRGPKGIFRKSIPVTVVNETPKAEPKKGTKIISNEDIGYFKTYIEKSNGVYPKEFFTSVTRFKEFYNPETGKRQNAPQSSKWILNDNQLYDLVDKDGGEVYISDVDLNTGMKYSAEVSTEPSTNVKPTINLSKEWRGDLDSRPVYTSEGINTMRTSAAKANEHFGNPFSEAGYGNTRKVPSIGAAVQAYKDWLLTGYAVWLDENGEAEDFAGNQEQRQWILSQINQGKLDNATLLYAGKSAARGQGMHPTALAEVVEELRKNVQKVSPKVTSQSNTTKNIAERFNDILKNPDLKNNFLLNNLYINTDSLGNEIQFSLKNTDTKTFGREYREAFMVGLNSTIPEVNSFFKDLALGSYMQFGSHYNPTGINNIIPGETYMDMNQSAVENLNLLRERNPKAFQDYLTLVRFGTFMANNLAGPISVSPSFVKENYAEQLKGIVKLSPQVLTRMIGLEQSVKQALSNVPLTDNDINDLPTIQPNCS